VLSIHLIAEKNPIREMASYYFGARAGRAEVSSRVRLAKTQRVVALAELSNGTWWSDAVQVEVGEPSCGEDA
jgi:sulfur-oxidizing protein SoxY